MFYREAIMRRRSRRSFTGKLPDISHVKMIKNIIDEINEDNNLSIQMIIDEPAGFSGIKSTYGMFNGVKNYIALVGPKSDENVHEKLGYFGEQILLTCEVLGYGTCWVGGTFDRDKCKCKVDEDEVFVCAIVFGNVRKNTSIREKAVTKALHSVTKKPKLKELFHAREEVPNWFIEGMRMVERAPSALNKMPVKFFYSGDGVMAKVKNPKVINYYDLGIAKFHFKIGAEEGTWDFGNGGIFLRDEE